MSQPLRSLDPRRVVALLTDFGTADIYVGVMKGVIAGIAPGATVVDLTHEIAPQDVRGAARSILSGYRYFPSTTVFCCVVDPGVGTSRRAVAVELAGSDGVFTFVCPDNGLLTPLLDLPTLARARAVVLDDPSFHLPNVGATFHGRDVFAPAAAHLAAGIQLSDLGSACAADSLVRLEWSGPVATGHGYVARVIHVDRFGNLVTDLEAAEFGGRPGAWRVTVGELTVAGLSGTFADAAIGEPVAYVGSSGLLELAVRQGNAAREWGVGVGAEVLIDEVTD
jgi:S-adenosylmethionine hydrolase